MNILFLVIEKFKDTKEVYKRVREKGRMMPKGMTYVDSWVSLDGNTCWQINDCENEEQLHEWVSHWKDVCDCECIPVITSHEMSEKMMNVK